MLFRTYILVNFGDSVDKFNRIVSDRFKKIIKRYKKVGYNLDVMQQSWERSGSVVKCLTRDQGFEPHRRTALLSLSKTHLS